MWTTKKVMTGLNEVIVTPCEAFVDKGYYHVRVNPIDYKQAVKLIEDDECLYEDYLLGRVISA